MKTLRHQIAAEFRQLPGTLGKLIGGATVGTGMLAAVLGYKHGVPSSIVFGIIALGAGVWLFARSSTWLKERKSDVAQTTDGANARLRLNILTWGLFACIALVFLLIVQIMTGM